MPTKDYYAILGVAKNATTDELKQAYRRKAKLYHPDTTEDKDGEAKFKEVGEAWETLKEPDDRAIYDRYGSAGPQTRSRPYNNQTAGGIDVDELMRRWRDIHAEDPDFQAGGGMVEQRVVIPVDTIINGGPATFRFVTQHDSGRGFVSMLQHIAETTLKPNTKIGTAFELETYPHMKFIVAPNGGHQTCAVQGLDLLVPFELNPLIAMAGETAKVKHPNGKIFEITVPAGSRNGAALRLPKMGLSHVNGAVGSLLAIINFVTPKLSESQRAALKKILKEG